MNELQKIIEVFCTISGDLKKLLAKLDPEGRKIVSTVQYIDFSTVQQNSVILQKNPHRIGFIANNQSANDEFLSFDPTRCSDKFFTIKIASLGGEYYIPNRDPYRGDIRIYMSDTSSSAYGTITELSYE